ncbi:hypothetical protein [Methylobacterium haplocladii]|uniref:DNA-binding protein n=1 Tax=Methylobacterium haplocladii TaxID=1176176 RepID=A0A512IP86_9HYPH|nr:hypothetical protein [Methylobacterium haplocladii]GEO99514.1 hypothetical protein MHA02_19020 [Methylobacterium haplocladii]GJD83657.1 hypothetical protein HPGCJGGD_1527 [Methylobacterium haplocladii]GLS59747.1 hypothetical protein GCM10007887_24190 [Methylobacterium haplocladii]
MTDLQQPLSRGPAEPCPPKAGKPRLRRWEASRYLLDRYGIEMAIATLAKLACLGGGPPFQKNGRVPLYPTDLLDEWAVARLGKVVRSTSEDGHA